MRDHLESQLGAAYPQANLRQVASEDDAALCRPDEQVQCRMLALRAPAYLPIRTFSDLEIDGEHASQADPVLGILGALGELPPGWRGLSQLVLEPTTDDWCRDYLRFAVQHPLAPERMARPTENSGAFVVFLALLLGLGAFGLQAYAWYRAHDWPALVGGGAAAMIAVAVVAWVARRLLRRPLYDMDLVRQKVSRLAYRVELRLSVFAPAAVDRGEVAERMERFVAAYRHFNLAAGNGFRVRRTRIDVAGCDLRCPRAIVPRRPSILTTRELAGLWHLPHAAADVALLERTTARRWLPLPASVVDGFRIGEAGHQSRRVPVAIPSDILRRHLLLVAKTRRGKSSLMLRMAQHAMLSQPRRAVLLVDPHRDLAEAALGLVPPERRDDAVYVDVSDVVRPVGLNVLDTGLGWDRDRAVANALAIFQREWGDRFWGPRMEDAFRFGLLSLFAANQALCASDPIGGRSKQYTLLDLPSVFGDTAFRRMVLRDVSDPTIKRWWSTYFGTLDQRFRLEIVNPILTKIHRFEGSAAARLVVGQPMSTLDPAAWLRDGAVVIVNTARGTVGENAAALLGGTLLNLVSLAVAEQARRGAGGAGCDQHLRRRELEHNFLRKEWPRARAR
jgi:hypothetical protein